MKCLRAVSGIGSGLAAGSEIKGGNNMVHEIKIGTGFADAVESGEKTFEIRRNDRGYRYERRSGKLHQKSGFVCF